MSGVENCILKGAISSILAPKSTTPRGHIRTLCCVYRVMPSLNHVIGSAGVSCSETRILKAMQRILVDPSRVIRPEYELLPSGR